MAFAKERVAFSADKSLKNGEMCVVIHYIICCGSQAYSFIEPDCSTSATAAT